MIPVSCDGCGRTSSPDHISQRLRRLEVSTQFRPSQIKVLFLSDAPPDSLADSFYQPPECGTRSAGAQAFFDAVMAAVGLSTVDGNGERKDESELLAKFKRRGFYYAECAECPLEPEWSLRGHEMASPDELEFAARFGNGVARRIQFSYKPRCIVLLSRRNRGLIPVLTQAGLGERLLLHEGEPLHLPVPGDSALTVRFILRVGRLAAQADPALMA